jgi:Spy/CpxP family protein refolding chaperone
MRCVLAALTIALLLPATAQAQQPGSDPVRRAAMEARRDSLEAEIMNRFMTLLNRELRLDADQRARTERTLRAGADRRRDLMRASAELRGELHRALRSNATSDADFVRLLTEHETLRQRESELWRREQDELARILTPRQRAHFVVQWARFQESIRDIVIQQARPAGGPPRSQPRP